MHAGGSVLPHIITPAERAVCEAIKDRLLQDGLYFVGLDLISGKLIEVNCVSPAGIPRINNLDQVHLEAV